MLGFTLVKKYRQAIAMFRVGVASINIQLLRYGSAMRLVEERKCFICTGEVALTQCPLYDDIRQGWFNHLHKCVTQFENVLDVKKILLYLKQY